MLLAILILVVYIFDKLFQKDLWSRAVSIQKFCAVLCFLCLCSALSRSMRMVHMARQKQALIESQQRVATWLNCKVS